jgi:hypothetical protein
VAGGAARLIAAIYVRNEPANLLTCDHREAVANLLNGKTALAYFGERMDKTQVSTSFVHREQTGTDSPNSGESRQIPEKLLYIHAFQLA